MKQSASPVVKELVLVGGGHTHAIALRMFGMKPLPGVRITLITEASDTAYSGMLPGHVAGFYSREECHIDLRPLTQFAGAQLYLDQAIGLDLANNRVICANRPPVAFDVLSIDIGSTPQMPDLIGASECVIPAKPVRRFLADWDRVVAEIATAPDQPICLAIVGGGAGGVELALTMQRHVQTILKQAGQPIEHLTLHLLQRQSELMPGHSRWVRDRFRSLLAERGIHLHFQETISDIQPQQIHCKSGLTIDCDHIFWVTQASAPDWLSKSGLEVDQDGFVLVDDNLRSSHLQVFAAGDIASMVNHPRPKAGVFAVRQGKPLFNNLRRTLQGKSLKPFHPQKQYLSLIGTADGSAIASWGALGWQSPLLWTLKDRIDRAFMQRFSHLPAMQGSQSTESQLNQPSKATHSTLATSPSIMPCAGCGAKVGSSTLNRVLQRLPSSPLPVPNPSPSAKILIGLDAPDDAAVVQIPSNLVMVQTIDYFPALINDPFVFGQISANHALSDLFAMGAQPHSALAIATLPYASPASMEETLYQVLSGAVNVLHQANATLIGGHTTEAADLAFGLSCNGVAHFDRLLHKGGMQPNQTLILTKAIGTGTLFAANMRHRAKGYWIDRAIESMLLSNQQSAACFLQHGATACTDITGFGLIGHLHEMIQASNVAIKLHLETIPLLPGALDTIEMGIVSSLQPQNLQSAQSIHNLFEIQNTPIFPLLFDPQTSGGLLATVPNDQADRCLIALKNFGYPDASIIGHTLPHQEGTKPITIM